MGTGHTDTWGSRSSQIQTRHCMYICLWCVTPGCSLAHEAATVGIDYIHVPSAPCLGSMPSNSECMAIPGYCRGVELDWAVQEYQNDGTPRLGSPWCGTEKCNACREECRGITICKCNCAAMYGECCKKSPVSCIQHRPVKIDKMPVQATIGCRALALAMRYGLSAWRSAAMSPSRRPGWWACRSLKTPSPVPCLDGQPPTGSRWFLVLAGDVSMSGVRMY